MAVTLVSRPTTPNVTGTKLIYEVSGSTTTSNPQYSYLMDIYESGSSDRIARILQTPNPEGVAEFNPASIFQGQLNSKVDLLTTSSGYYDTESYKTFQVKFGEVYGTSTSSSITYYPDLIDTEIQVFMGTVDPNSGNYNFPSESYYPFFPNDAEEVALLTRPILDYSPTFDQFVHLPVSSDDYNTVSLLKSQFYKINNSSPSPAGSFNILIAFEDGTVEIWNVPIDVGVVADDTGIINIPTGPANLKQLSTTGNFYGYTFTQAFNLPWTIVLTTVRATITLGTPRNSNIFEDQYYNPGATRQALKLAFSDDLSEAFIIQNGCNDYTRFAFVNKNGIFEYFSVYNPLQRESTAEKNIVSLPKVDYSGTVSTYSYETGGDKDYHVDRNDSYSITTQYLTKDIANWLEELLESPEVYVQQPQGFIPIVITSTEYTADTSQPRNKLFQYTIDFVLSKGRELQQQGFTFNLPPTPSPTQTTTPTPTPTLTPTPTPSALPSTPILNPTWYYRADQPGGSPNSQWQDTYGSGPNVSIATIRVTHVTNQTLGGYTSDWYESDPNADAPPLTDPNRAMVFNASGTGVGITGSNFTIQGWYYINEFKSINEDDPKSAFFTYRAGDQVPSSTVYEVGVGTVPSGSEQVLFIGGDTPGGSVVQTFPDITFETGSWYQISLVRNGSTFADNTVYVNKGLGNSPTASNAIHISGSSAEIYGNFWNNNTVLSGSMANLLLYSTSSLSESQIDTNYDRINQYLSI